MIYFDKIMFGLMIDIELYYRYAPPLILPFFIRGRILIMSQDRQDSNRTDSHIQTCDSEAISALLIPCNCNSRLECSPIVIKNRLFKAKVAYLFKYYIFEKL